jgi:hypothetical protein
MWSCETPKISHFLDNRLTYGGENFSLTQRPPFTTPERFLVLISVRAESIPGDSAAGTDWIN